MFAGWTCIGPRTLEVKNMVQFSDARAVPYASYPQYDEFINPSQNWVILIGTKGYAHVDSVEIGSRHVHRRRAGSGWCCNLGNNGRSAFLIELETAKLGGLSLGEARLALKIRA